VVAARIDHLEEIAKQVLETAAVIGRLVAMSILKPVAALPNDELLEAISQLRQAELLYDLPPYDQGLLGFRHPLIQEVAYATQLRSRLVALPAPSRKRSSLSIGESSTSSQGFWLITTKRPDRRWRLSAISSVPRNGSARRIPPKRSRTGKEFARCCRINRNPSTMTGSVLLRAVRS
jgi:hypothetical protein